MNDGFVTMSITLPKELEAFVTAQVACGAYASVDEFLRKLLHRERLERDRELFELELADIIEKRNWIEVTPEYWESLRKEVIARVERRRPAAREPGRQ